jgi:16S rRNA (adenine1518-N6/adenine1519-N6)-dimethyltransferase
VHDGHHQAMQFPYAKKSLGQNFLTSQGALADIIAAAEVKKGDEVLEIGPGRGVLTKELLKVGASVTAIEKDGELVPLLREQFVKEIKKKQLNIIEADILEFDLSSYTTSLKAPYKLIANIPYYITGQIFRLFLEGEQQVQEGHLLAQKQPSSMTLLVQKEVAERIVAKEGKESILSMSVKAYGIPKYIATVKRGSFSPAPNVDSAILHISSISKDFFIKNLIDEKTFFAVLKAAFAHKRKIISKNLSDKGFIVPASLNKKARAEDLTLSDFAIITKANLPLN